ncbi:MAG: hypothetical protein SGJ24_17770 [Chloroflexota bacterium]|nr:hypothetical protein [Chloroflexota bacterium]
MFKHRMLIVLVLLFVAVLPTFAQTGAPLAPVNPNANISWPPPVYVVRGAFQVRGTANLPGMSNYFLEFRALGADMQPVTGADAWFPALLPSTAPVVEGILGTWDTRAVAEGVYELRLTVNVAGVNARAAGRLPDPDRKRTAPLRRHADDSAAADRDPRDRDDRPDCRLDPACDYHHAAGQCP